MRYRLAAALVLACTVTGLAAAQSSSPPQTSPTPTPGPSKRLNLTGCVQDSEGGLDQYVLVDGHEKTMYRLSGKGLRAYVGRHVRIVGGLYPSATVAAQAGAVDPGQATIAALPGHAGTGVVPGEFRVQRVQRLPGTCPQP